MAYIIKIERIKPPTPDDKYPKNDTIYEQVVDEGLFNLLDVIKAVNGINYEINGHEKN